MLIDDNGWSMIMTMMDDDDSDVACSLGERGRGSCMCVPSLREIKQACFFFLYLSERT